MLPNGSKIEVQQQGKLNILEAPNITQMVNIRPKPASTLLLSVRKLVDKGCEAYFTKHKEIILKNKKRILQGFWNTTDGLYNVIFPVGVKKVNPQHRMIETIPEQNINVVIHLDTNRIELAQFLHGTLFSPSIRTLKQAIKMITS